ncbi:MAG TPA: efflux RND transporter periplasmic adaptor subunit [Enhygromyxa sp.]|nr:efflux RND transporter periplasmic adaptor subunit [Enhygromyxa sp.]
MTVRTLFSVAAALSLGLGLPACDTSKAESGPSLPEPTGEQAPARVEIPTPTKAMAGETAYETVNHRWIGSVRPKHHVELAPGMTGVIASIEVEEGDTVKAGEQMFRIEGSEVKLAVSQAQAALAGAELQLAEAERETDRTRKLAERGSVGAANLERAEAGVAAAEAGVKQAKAAVSMAKARSADLVVKSPISGIVTAKYKNVGEVATMMPPTTVVVIDDLSLVEVRVRVPELKLREVDVGSSVKVYFPALDEQLEVPVTRIGNAVDPHTRTIELIIEVPNPKLRIKSGMSVEVEIGRAPEQAGAPTQEQPTAMATAPQAGHSPG